MTIGSMKITTRCFYRTFSNGDRCNQFAIEDGKVLAYDDIAGHYTYCHALTQHQERMILAEARKAS